MLETESSDLLPPSGERGVCRLKVRYRQMGKSQSVIQWLRQLGKLRSSRVGSGYLRTAKLAVCFITMGALAYPADSQDGEGGEPRPDTGQQAELTLYPKQDWGKYLEPPCGEILVPREKIQAWERFPSGFFLTKGAGVAELEEGLPLKVLGTRKFASLLAGDRYYLRVEPAYPENTTVEAAKCLESGVQCWVFQGEEDADLPENLLPPDIRATNTDSPEEAR